MSSLGMNHQLDDQEYTVALVEDLTQPNGALYTGNVKQYQGP